MKKKITYSKSEVIDFFTRALFTFIGEFMGTGILMFIGCSTEIIHGNKPKENIGIALSFSLSYVAAIESVFFISGGLVNPVLAVAGMIYKKFSVAMGLVYIAAELLGATLGYGFLFTLTPEQHIYRGHKAAFCVVERDDHITITESVLIEFVATSILVLVVCSLWDPRNTSHQFDSVKIAFVFFAISYGACSLAGCCLNPARAFGPALWNNNWKDHWISWISPISAAAVWSYFYAIIYLYFMCRIPVMIGTAILVFLGCLGVCKGLGQTGDHTGVVLSFALAVFISIQVTCHNSGGHVNPAVTILSLFFKKLSLPMAAVYILGQIMGGIVGYGFLKAVTPSHLIHKNGFEEYGLCSTVPNPEISLFQAVLAEFFLSSILLLVVCSAWDPRNAHHDSVTLKFGFTIYSLAYAGISYSGCSMNPARSFGPAMWNQTWKHHWIYWVSPLTAALFCGFTYTTFFCPKILPPTAQKPNGNKDELELGSVRH